MSFYPEHVLAAVVEIATAAKVQAKPPTDDRDPDTIREMTHMAVTHGATAFSSIFGFHSFPIFTPFPRKRKLIMRPKRALR